MFQGVTQSAHHGRDRLLPDYCGQAGVVCEQEPVSTKHIVSLMRLTKKTDWIIMIYSVDCLNVCQYSAMAFGRDSHFHLHFFQCTL